MSNEELLKPRWKVIADYPKSLYHVGDILNGGWRSEDLIYCDHDGPRWSHYPHLFEKLEWWEERKEGELPKFVKIEDKVLPVKKWLIEPNSVWLNVHYPEPSFTMGSKYYPSVYPSTEDEYNAHCQTKSQIEA